jgi:hypothetical protein
MRIPSHSEYDIDEIGNVTHLETGELQNIYLNRFGNKVVTLITRRNNKSHLTRQRIDKLILRTFKPYKNDNVDDRWLSVLFKDNDKSNVVLSNLEWDETWYEPSKIPGVNCPFGTWIDIPDYDNLQATLDPDIKIRLKDTQYEIPFGTNNSGYKVFKTTKSGTGSVHRAAATLFLNHPLDTSELVVNHKNGDRLDFRLSNLEWTTQSENMHHGYNYGKGAKNLNSITAFCIENNNILSFPNLSSAARYFNTTASSISDLVKVPMFCTKSYKGHIFRYKSEKIDWGNLKNIKCDSRDLIKIAVKYLDTDDVKIYCGYEELRSSENIYSNEIWRVLSREFVTPYKRRLFQVYDEAELLWPIYPSRLIEAFERCARSSFPYKVSYNDGRIEYVSSISEWVHNYGKDDQYSTIVGTINRYGSYKGIGFSKVNPAEFYPNYKEPKDDEIIEETASHSIVVDPYIGPLFRESEFESSRISIPQYPSYTITYDGVIKLIETEETIPEKRGRFGARSVRLKSSSCMYSLKRLDKLVLSTYKPLPPGKDPEWMSVRFLDGNRDNISIDNLEWSDEWYYPPNLEELKTSSERVWFPVPSMDRLEVSLFPDLKFRNKRSRRFIKPFIPKDAKYPSLAVEGKGILVHRAIALTFLSHPIDPTDIVVNHIDSNKLNYDLSNLEWVTHSENAIHANAEGVKAKSIRRIQSLCLSTGIVTEYNGFGDLHRSFGVSNGTLDYVVKHKTNRGEPWKDHLFRFSDDPLSWDDIKKMRSIRGVKGNKTKVAVKYLDTGEVKIYDGLKNMCRSEKISSSQLKRILSKKVIPPNSNRMFQLYTGNELHWPEYPREIVEVFSSAKSKSNPLKVTSPNGTVEYASDVRSWIDKNKIEISQSRINECINKKYQWRGYSFEPINLSDYH